MMLKFIFLLGILIVNVGALGKLLDLTWDFDNETMYWTGIQPFKYTKIVENQSSGDYWYAMKEFCAGEHGGTHFDAPYHFYKDGWKVSEVPFERLFAEGAFIDISNTNNDILTIQDLENWVQINGEFKNNTALLIKYGRSQYWHNKTKYMGLDSEGHPNFPGLSAETANWIVNSGKIVGVGVDTPSVDIGNSTEFPVHRILNKNQIYLMENVKLLEPLPARGFTIAALPMKLKEGTGGPLRVAAILD